MFTVQSTHSSGARLGALQTAHGVLQTPFFMPIATKGAVKTLSAVDMQHIQQAVDADTGTILLSNTYHNYIKPGLDILHAAKGLQKFMNWDGALLTDSGGFQIFSLAKLRRLNADGVEFRSHLDGSKHLFTPEVSMEIQSIIGADIWMAFDYFPGYPATKAQVEESITLTTSWAHRSKEWFDAYMQNQEAGAHQLFGIVQGGVYPELRKKSAEEITAYNFDGYAIGGLAVGEPTEEMYTVLEQTIPLLPADKPHYLMGAGFPEQILEAVKRGVDMFDCVLPTRNARHGSLFVHDITRSDRIVDSTLSETVYSKMNIRTEQYAYDFAPIDSACRCFTCTQGFSRSYIRHLFTVQDPLAARLATIHNITFYLQLMKEIRDAISLDQTASNLVESPV